MLHRLLRPALVLSAFLLITASLAHAATISVLGDLVVRSGVKVERTTEGLRITGATDREGDCLTKQEFKPPFILTAVVQSKKGSLRLSYCRLGHVLFNWEDNPTQLRYLEPQRDYFHWWDNKGAIPRNQWVTIRWIMQKDKVRIEVNGSELVTLDLDNSHLSGPVGFQTYHDSSIVVRSFTLTRGTDDADAATGPGLVSSLINVDVPTTPPDDLPPVDPATLAQPVDPNAVARPAWRNKAKPFVRDLTSVTSMSVIVTGDGELIGRTMDIIGSVPRASRGGTSAGAGFTRLDGDDDMKASFEEAARAVQMRYPFWQPGHLDISFGDKLSTHTGPSAGCAFGLLMLSALEGTELDPRCAVTGDVSVDWRVREVGGVNAKVHGAALDHCLYAAIPTANAPAIADLPILYGKDALWHIQILTVDTLQDALALARTDRASNLRSALDQFAALAKDLDAAPDTLMKPATRDRLQAILALAPNHVSARQLLAISEGKASSTLSFNGTFYKLAVAYHPFAELLDTDTPLDRLIISPEMTALVRKRLNELRPIADRKFLPIIADVTALVNVIQAYSAHRTTARAVLAAYQRIDAHFAELHSEPGYIDKLIREGY